MFLVSVYMERVCVCGAPRKHHAHAHDQHGRLSVPSMTTNCEQFVDAIELELGGDPRANQHLRPLMTDGGD